MDALLFDLAQHDCTAATLALAAGDGSLVKRLVSSAERFLRARVLGPAEGRVREATAIC